jgi:type III pantothenate kinase
MAIPLNSQLPTHAAQHAFLLIDISNSYTKIARAGLAGSLGRVARLRTRELSERGFAKAIRGWRFETAVISSVVPEAEKILLRVLKKSRVLRVGPKLNLGVGIDYPKPKTIGADRLANAASATAIYGAPVVVIDFGTAVTFDIISPDKKYVGGVIAPGLEVMTDYLYQRTALLPRIDLLEPTSAIGKTTRAAMMAGAIFGYRGLIKQILVEIRRELAPAKKVKVVATGGYAELIAAKLPEIQFVHRNLTLEGLRIIGRLNS